MTYDGAVAAAETASSGFEGGGWAVWGALGDVIRTAVTIPFNTSSAECPASWITTPSGTLLLPATPADSPNGTSAIWAVDLYQGVSEPNVTLLFVTVIGGTATLWFTGSLAVCHSLSDLVPSNAPIPTGAVDSSTAANSTNALGGGAFLARVPEANQLLAVDTTVAGSLPSTVWFLEYTSDACSAGRDYTFATTVNGLTGAVLTLANYSVPCPPAAFSLKFTETGFAAGNDWWVKVANATSNHTYSVSTSAISIDLPNGSYNYQIYNLAGATATPGSGSVDITGENRTIAIVFTASVLGGSATFTEVDLPSGSTWYVTLSGYNLTETVNGTTSPDTIVIFLGIGTYSYSANTTLSGYYSSAHSSGFLVDGAPLSFTVGFGPIPVHGLKFIESGLPTGTWWGVAPTYSLIYSTSSTPTVSFEVPNGAYNFTVALIAGYIASPITGNLTIADDNVTQLVVFTAVPEFPVTVSESGLPTGGTWTVLLQSTATGDRFSTSLGPSIIIDEPNGTYTFYVFTELTDLVASPLAGFISVTGGPATQAIQFEPEYLLTFSAPGLATGLKWSIELTSPTIEFNESNTSTMTFRATNGTVDFSVTGVPAGYNATPLSGSVSISGGNAFQAIDFTPSPGFYAVTFSESGLPTGTPWVVNFDSDRVRSTGTTVVFEAPNGTFGYTVFPPTGYSPRPGSGSLTVSGEPVDQSIAFVPEMFSVTFTESNLPTGTTWSVSMNSERRSSTTASIVYTEPNGSFPFTVFPIVGYSARPGSGTVKVNGAAVQEPIDFVSESFSITFTESGLPAGTSWSVVLNGSPRSSTSASIAFTETNGTYPYRVGPVAGYTPDPASGSVLLSGAPFDQTIVFSVSTYSLWFNETGLSAGTSWTVVLGSTPLSSTSPSIEFTEPNGTYSYTVDQMPREQSSPASGTLTLSGSSASVTITFAPVAKEDFAVTFTETGLAQSTSWSVTVGSVTGSSEGPTIVFEEPNGTYSFTVGAIAGMASTPSSGIVSVSGASSDVPVAFAALAKGDYSITFTEVGLPTGSSWAITIGSVTLTSLGPTLVFTESNGTYGYSVVAVAGYSASPASGSARVDGSAVSESIAFSKSTPASGGSGLLGLPGDDGYGLLGGIVAVIVIAGGLLALRRKPPIPRSAESPPPSAPPTGGTP